MHLKPLRRGARPALTDASAAPPAALADVPKRDLRKRLAGIVDRIAARQTALFAEGKRALLIVLQGLDTSGKDGTIRHVFGPLNPMGVQITSFKVPTPIEAAHDFLWRVHLAIPAKGMIGIFNRSHYEDVLVVRVHRLAPEPVWRARFDMINGFERYLTETGTTVLKFCLHISREEQRERLLARLDDPEKNWKFNAGDLKERDRWTDYVRAYADALRLTNTAWAPWYVVPADRKPVRDMLVAEVVRDTLDRLNPRYPAVGAEARQLRAILRKD
ncbi:MAG TPA: PPK2 family polyphosphate kinase [Gemmatimonadales bacterium]|nr:PPK2 family polyphosphate kinase [Gemmatimonadales bacterium]